MADTFILQAQGLVKRFHEGPLDVTILQGVDLQVSRDLNRRFQLFIGAQNLTNKVFFVQTNPSTVGAPRLVTGGVRVRFSSR